MVLFGAVLSPASAQQPSPEVTAAAAHKKIEELAVSDKLLGNAGFAIGADPETGKVNVLGADAATRANVLRYFKEDEVQFSETGFVFNVGGYATDGEPHYGGASITRVVNGVPDTAVCTTGFLIFRIDGGGIHKYSATANHCVASILDTYEGNDPPIATRVDWYAKNALWVEFYGKSTNNARDRWGDVAAVSWPTETYGPDLPLQPGDRVYRSQVGTSSGASIAITGKKAKPKLGDDNITRFGQTTGRVEGYFMETDYWLCIGAFKDDPRPPVCYWVSVFEHVSDLPTTAGGDSGGPYWMSDGGSGQLAMGMHLGIPDPDLCIPGECDRVFVTWVSTIERIVGGAIATGQINLPYPGRLL